MDREQAWAIAARRLGLRKFEKSCRRTMNITGREALAWKVPGTRENGEHCQLLRDITTLAGRIQKEPTNANP